MSEQRIERIKHRQKKAREDLARWGDKYIVGLITLDDIDHLLSLIDGNEEDAAPMTELGHALSSLTTSMRETPEVIKVWAAFWRLNARLLARDGKAPTISETCPNGDPCPNEAQGVECGHCLWHERITLEALQSTPVHKQRCVLCGHNATHPNDGTCMAPVPICSDDYHGTRRCGCKCKFSAGKAQQLGADTNWPLSDVLTGLVEWAKHLHDDHECDCIGWERRSFLIDAATRYASEIAVSVGKEAGEQRAEFIYVNPTCDSCRRTDGLHNALCQTPNAIAQRRAESELIDAAIAWHESGEEGESGEWFGAGERLSDTIRNLLRFRLRPAAGVDRREIEE